LPSVTAAWSQGDAAALPGRPSVTASFKPLDRSPA